MTILVGGFRESAVDPGRWLSNENRNGWRDAPSPLLPGWYLLVSFLTATIQEDKVILSVDRVEAAVLNVSPR